MLPLAPGLLSTTTAWPSAACMAAATGRSEMSDGPAGGLGTTMRMGLALGHSWARAGAAHSTAAVRAPAAPALAAGGLGLLVSLSVSCGQCTQAAANASNPSALA